MPEHKIVTITGNQQAASIVGKSENGFVGRIPRKSFAQQRDLVAELLQQIAQVVWDVMIKQEFTRKPGPSAGQQAGQSLRGGPHSRRGTRRSEIW